MDEHSTTILIVDDLEFNIELLTDMLEGSYNIVSAGNGKEGLEILRSGKHKIDAILLDLVMPEMTGYDFLEEISRDAGLNTIPVIVVTSDDEHEARSKAFELGAVDFVPRKIDMSALQHRIKSVLRLCEMDKVRVENEILRAEIKTEKHLRALMDNLPGGVAVIKTDTNTALCEYYNHSLPDLFGMKPEEFSAQFSHEPVPSWIKSFMLEARSSKRFSYIFSIPDPKVAGFYQWIRITASVIGEKNGILEIYCVFLDINAEKRQEQRAKDSDKKLRDSELQLDALIQNAPGGIICARLGNDGNFHSLYVSPGLSELLGYPDYDSCCEALSKNIYEGISDEEAKHLSDKIKKAASSGEQIKSSFPYSRGDVRLWLSFSGKTAMTDEGELRLYSFVTDTTAEREYQQNLSRAAYTDALTELPNRNAFILRAQEILAENSLREYSILKLNVGGFKVVNDLSGRDVGDKLLKVIGDSLSAVIGGEGLVARFFADQFVIMVPYSERAIHPQSILSAVSRDIAKSRVVTHDVQCYIGVYKITDRTISIENMVDRASMACRAVTGSYRDHVAFYDEKMRRRMLEEQEIYDESHRAITNKEFCIYYQPVYGIKAKKFVSAEALVRWNHPKKGMISPGKFIPVFEKNGFITELDAYVLEEVCIYHKKRRDNGLEPFPVSMNISRLSLYNPRLFEMINDLTEKYGVNPKYFRIEITESAYNDNPAQLLETIRKLRAAGYPILMDDFGSGYSSLNTLKDIPIDLLKLDMKFLEDFEKNNKVGIIVTSMARMGRWLSLPILAEGVENAKQFEFLESIGCQYIQGYYFSRPVPEDEFTRIVSQFKIVSEDSALSSDSRLSLDVSEVFGKNEIVSGLLGTVFGGLAFYEYNGENLEVIRVNEEYTRIFGEVPDDGEAWHYTHPEDMEKTREAVREAIRTGLPVRNISRGFASGGEIRYFDCVVRKLSGNESMGILCISINDITDRISSSDPSELMKLTNIGEDEAKARLEYEKTDNLLRKTVQHIPVGLGIFLIENNNLNPIYFSDQTRKLFGINFISKEFGSSGIDFSFVFESAGNIGSTLEHKFSHTRPDGHKVWIKAICRALEDARGTMVYTVMSDISSEVEVRKRESALEQIYQALIEESGTIIFNYNPDADTVTYFRSDDGGGKEYKTVSELTSNPEEFTLLESLDRDNFIGVLKKLSDAEDTAEIDVKLMVEGYPRRHRASFRSIADEDGVVFRVVGKIEDVDDEMARLDEIQARAMYDALCIDVYNKATTEELIRAELERSTSGALMMIDVDDFKSINDSFGHIFGDEFLKIFATTLKSIFRDTDIIGRYGGDEYFIYMPRATAALSEKKGNQILQKIASLNIPELEGGIKSSIGVAVVTPENRNYRTLLKQADSALYQAKNRGKNCVVVFDSKTMSEGVYRTEEAVKQGRNSVVLSANPSGASQLSMRVFSALYGSKNLDQGINQILELVGKSFGVSRVYIFEDSEDGSRTTNTFEWCNSGIAPAMSFHAGGSYSGSLSGDYYKNFNDDGIFYCHDISEQTDEKQREIFRNLHVRSVLQCLILENRTPRGFIGFDECTGTRFWTQDQIDSLVFLSRIMSIFLMKDRAKNISDTVALSLKSVLDELPIFLYIVDKQTLRLLYLNKASRDIIGNQIGELCSKAFQCSAATDGCPIEDLLKNKSEVVPRIIKDPSLNGKTFKGVLRTAAREVIWNGAQAYLVSGELADDEGHVGKVFL